MTRLVRTLWRFSPMGLFVTWAKGNQFDAVLAERNEWRRLANHYARVIETTRVNLTKLRSDADVLEAASRQALDVAMGEHRRADLAVAAAEERNELVGELTAKLEAKGATP